MNRRNGNNIKYAIISVILVLVVLIGITSFNVNNEDRNLNFFEKAIKDTTTFISKIVTSPTRIFKNNKNSDDKLKEKAAKTDMYYAEIKELQKEVDELKKTLELNATLSEYTTINCTVVNRNIGYWYNNLTIDKGSKNGIKKGDAVVTNEGLIGKVVSLSNFSSSIKLLTSDEISNKISVKIEDDNNYYYGLLIGYNREKKVYEIEGLTDYKKIKEGDIVTTTGLTDYFPSGLLVGKVSKIVKDEYDLSSIVEITPAVNFENISTVVVLNRRAEE